MRCLRNACQRATSVIRKRRSKIGSWYAPGDVDIFCALRLVEAATCWGQSHACSRALRLQISGYRNHQGPAQNLASRFDGSTREEGDGQCRVLAARQLSPEARRQRANNRNTLAGPADPWDKPPSTGEYLGGANPGLQCHYRGRPPCYKGLSSPTTLPAIDRVSMTAMCTPRVCYYKSRPWLQGWLTRVPASRAKPLG